MYKGIINTLLDIIIMISFFLCHSCSLEWSTPDARPDLPIDFTEETGDLDTIMPDSPCPDGTPPRDEVCNGEDDDCDGDIDEDFTCSMGQLVTCITTCGSEGNGICGSDCEIPAGEQCIPPPETCNGEDDNCDDLIDNGFDCVMNAFEICSTACGEGTRVCGDDCKWGSCSGDVGECEPDTVQDCTSTLDCGIGSRVCDETCHWGDCELETVGEVCNGRDDDCNGTVDEGLFDNLSEDIRVTVTTDSSEVPIVVWTGSAFFLAWTQGSYGDGPDVSEREIYAARLDEAGTKLGSDIRITNAAADSYLAVPIVSGTEIAVFWGDYRNLTSYDVFMARISFSGTKLGSDILIVDSVGDAWVAGPVWSGLRYGVAWQDNRSDFEHYDIYFQIFDSGGAAASTQVQVTDTAVNENLPLKTLWTGSEYLSMFVADNEEGEGQHCRMARFSASGDLAAGPMDLTTENSVFCMPAWIDSELSGVTGFGLAWPTAFDSGDSDLRFEQHDTAGTLSAGPITVQGGATHSIFPFAFFNADHNAVAVSWVEAPEWGSGGECYFAEISIATPEEELQVVTGPVQVSTSGGNVSSFCSMAWTGSTYGFAWQDSRDIPGSPEIYFALLGCPEE